MADQAEAAGGQEAIDLAESARAAGEPFTLVLMGWKMPAIPGRGVA